MKIKYSTIAFVLASVFVATSLFITYFGFYAVDQYVSRLDGGVQAPVTYDQFGMEDFIDSTVNAYFFKTLPQSGLMVGAPIFLLGLACLLLGLGFRNLEKRVDALEKNGKAS
jgi:hypothetical protein